MVNWMRKSVKPLGSRFGVAVVPMPFPMKGVDPVDHRMPAVVEQGRRLIAGVGEAGVRARRAAAPRRRRGLCTQQLRVGVHDAPGVQSRAATRAPDSSPSDEEF